MSAVYNRYCDESCYLENDYQKSMGLGSVWCPDDKRAQIAKCMRKIKQRNTQQCGQANVNGTIMQSMRIPLPPYAEQLSVIAKVEELIALANQFMEQLSFNKEILNNLTSALLGREFS